MKQGILVAAFGSSQPQAHLANRRFDDRLRQAFPGIPIRWAFTSGIVRQRLSGEGFKTDSASKALEKMAFEQFTRVAVCSLLLIPGAEFEALKTDAARIAGSSPLRRVAVSPPLLSSEEDLEDVARAMAGLLSTERAPGEAGVYMGHGAWHEGDLWYDRLMPVVNRIDRNIYLATMEGARTIEALIPELVSRGVGGVWLVPFLAVAGAHVLRDMAGEHPGSWKSRLEAAGIECRPVLRGVSEDDGFASVWIRHLEQAVRELDDIS